ncbi:MAG: DoxX family protein [Actinomycetota bacterium]
MSIGILIMRVVIGLLFVGHGCQKLFGWFEGGGIEGTSRMFGSLGYHPPRAMAILGGVGEAGGGLLLTLGMLTPFGCAAIIGMMVNAIGAVHKKNGLWVSKGGSEYPLVLIAVTTGIAFAGAGRYSIDGVFTLGLNGFYWGVLAFLLGFAGGVVVLSIRNPRVVREREEQEPRAA